MIPWEMWRQGKYSGNGKRTGKVKPGMRTEMQSLHVPITQTDTGTQSPSPCVPLSFLSSLCLLYYCFLRGQALHDTVGDLEETREDEARDASKNAIVLRASRARASTVRHIESNAAARARLFCLAGCFVIGRKKADSTLRSS